MDNLTFARALMGISLAFHIVYTAIGIGLPFMLMIAEGLALFRKQEIYHQIARRWIRTAAVLFAIGAVSGTILSFELGFLWPGFMGFAGGLIGLPFSMEGFAFFTEAIFMGLYLYGENRLSRRALFLTTIPMVISAALSAVFVISANAWMNTPSGFTIENGQFTNVQPFVAMANPSWAHEAVHGTLASYVAAAFAVAGVYAFKLLRGERSEYHRKSLMLALITAAIFTPTMLLTGDWAARVVARIQPAKFAAMEGLFETQRGAPLTIGGWPDPVTRQMYFGIEIPGMLSFLGFRDFNAEVTGLDAFPEEDRPDPRPVHIFFQIMVGSFFIMMLPLLWAAWRWLRRKKLPEPWLDGSRNLLRLILLASPFGFIALESGWMVTEFGRQPWLARGVMRLSEGVTPREGLEWVFLTFLAVYFALTAGLIWLLLNPFPARTGNPTDQMEPND